MKNKPNSNLFLSLLGLVIIVTALVFFYLPRNEENTKSMTREPKNLRELEYEELSPNGLYKIILYYFAFDFSIFRDYSKDYFNNSMVVSVRDMKDGQEDYLFTGERIGEPKWLGNDHVFFTSYCGTGCKGLYLVNVLNKETRPGVLSYMSFEENRPVYTVFKDWFGREFKFDGIVDDIRSETLENMTHLIFYMRNDGQKFIGKKSFLFTGDALKE